MRAVLVGPDQELTWTEVPDPHAGPGEVVVDVRAAGLNRADLLQRQGHYPPPPGASEILGMECSGVVGAAGAGAESWSVGDRVCALLAGGGYAERVAVPAGQVLPVPDGVAVETAAALPEVLCTVWSNLVMVAGLRSGETLLVHGGGGGIGTAAIQVAAALGARVVATSGSAGKRQHCLDLGASAALDYAGDWVGDLHAVTDGGGADVILDVMGASYLRDNVRALAADGRLVVIGLQGGRQGDLDLGAMLPKRASLFATTLRSRPVEQKAAIVAEVRQHVWPMVEDGRVRIVVDSRFPMPEAARAQDRLASGEVMGKVLLTVP